ncbi:hypothetical protein Syun_000396 [Stephania yunnanensis]|uniref:NusG-like N-terminal domain-containing protein n=1 Tax=Stephania yunnanensis TaxID=152371 RepID=A0AAP0LC57_9MAGN
MNRSLLLLHHLQWSSSSWPRPSPPLLAALSTPSSSMGATMESSVRGAEGLTARERRQLRNERRESKFNNWREEVEERLIKKPKKRYASWTEELNLDNLAELGLQWWAVRVARVSGQDSAERMARALARDFAHIEFQVFYPAVEVKRKLKNGTISNKPKSLFPGCVFLKCVLNKEIHDFIRECDGIGGFVGSKVGNNKRQINRPRPISAEDMEAIFVQVEEEQKKADIAFKEEQRSEAIFKEEKLNVESYLQDGDANGSTTDEKPKRRTRKSSKSAVNSSLTVEDEKLPTPGSSVRVLSGPFTEFVGSLKKLDHQTGQATVGFMLFGKESLVDLDVNQIVAETA